MDEWNATKFWYLRFQELFWLWWSRVFSSSATRLTFVVLSETAEHLFSIFAMKFSVPIRVPLRIVCNNLSSDFSSGAIINYKCLFAIYDILASAEVSV